MKTKLTQVNYEPTNEKLQLTQLDERNEENIPPFEWQAERRYQYKSVHYDEDGMKIVIKKPFITTTAIAMVIATDGGNSSGHNNNNVPKNY